MFIEILSIIIVYICVLIDRCYKTVKVGGNIENVITVEPIMKTCVLDSHIDYLDENVPNYIRPKHQNGFNMSLVKHQGKYVCSIRYYNSVKGLVTNNIIPGNKEPPEKYKSYVKSIGKNFIWGCWKNKGMVDATVFFTCDFKDNKMSNFGDVQFIENMDTFHEKTPGIPFSISDVRLFSNSGKLYLYDGFITIIKDCDIKKPMMEKISYFNNQVCKSNGYEKKYDKNWAFFKESNTDFTFLHWFEETGVYTVTVPKNYNNGCVKQMLTPFNKDIIPALGNSYLPMFSFGTPFIKHGDFYFGAGHCKIQTTYPYDVNSNVSAFRKKVREIPDIIEHQSYIYTMYLIMITGDDFYISDNFLPLVDTKYKFSIIFPMSLVEIDDKISIISGYGDFYNISTTLSTDHFKELCKHNVKNFDKNKYEFHILPV
jgi:hypothetical protein